MAWRFAGRAEDRIDEVVMETAQRWGIETAARYNRLVFAALEAIRVTSSHPQTTRSHPSFPAPAPLSVASREAGHKLRGHNRDFGKHLKVICVERVDSLHVIGPHRRDNLQIKYVATCHRTTAKQA
jgi:hypothetical protein